MAESKVLTADGIMEYITDHHGDLKITETLGEYEFEIAEFVPFEVAKLIVQKVSEACFSSNGEYQPEMKDFAMRLFTILGYTNVSIPTVDTQDLESLNDIYKILYLSDLYEIILGNINWPQFEEITRAIDEKINYLKSANIDGIKKEIDKAMSGISGISDSLEKVFDNISSDDIEKIASAIENNKIDESKLVAAYLDTK